MARDACYWKKAERYDEYERATLDAGLAPSEEGYWTWREMEVRLSGIDYPIDLIAYRAAVAIESMGLCAGDAATKIAKVAEEFGVSASRFGELTKALNGRKG